MAYIILEKIEASQHIESIVAEKDLVNGQFVTLGDLAQIEEGGEAHLVTEMVAGDTDIVFHASVPTVYGDFENELDFKLKAGKAGRGYRLRDGNQIAFSKDLVTGVATVGAFVTPTATGVKVGAKPASGVYGKVVELGADLNAGEMIYVKFIK